MDRWVGLAAIIAAGLVSRVVHTGFVVFDKYLGDALYAAMVYTLLRLSGRVQRVWLWTALVMVGIEVFQLTGWPAGWVKSESVVARVCRRLMGTQFRVWDLVAYAVGIAVMEVSCKGLHGRKGTTGYLPTIQR
ncbi:MAG: DUF2809 domain-containing protein [Bryobacteraceae bacterium]